MTAPTIKVADKRSIPVRERIMAELSMREINPF
jgi:hypothetical protein